MNSSLDRAIFDCHSVGQASLVRRGANRALRARMGVFDVGFAINMLDRGLESLCGRCILCCLTSACAREV